MNFCVTNAMRSGWNRSKVKTEGQFYPLYKNGDPKSRDPIFYQQKKTPFLESRLIYSVGSDQPCCRFGEGSTVE